jgi:hypothetical protein
MGLSNQSKIKYGITREDDLMLVGKGAKSMTKGM